MNKTLDLKQVSSALYYQERKGHISIALQQLVIMQYLSKLLEAHL